MLLFALIFMGFLSVYAQKLKLSEEKIIATDSGKFSLQQLSSEIIKITYLPKGYSATENLSDAVILIPKSNIAFTIPIIQKEQQISIANTVTIKSVLNTNNYRGFQFSLANDEKIFGGGEMALPLNRRGYRLDLYNAPWYGYENGADHLNYSVPFFTSSKGYGILFDNPSKSYVDIGKQNASVWEYEASSGALTFYIILGKDYKAILTNYFSLTGTQPLPPKWVFGNLMSRFGYTSEQQVDSIYNKMQQENIPLDAIIYDLFWFGDSIKQTMGNLDWVNKIKWPNPERMIAKYKQQHIQTILVTEPFVVQKTLAYNSSKPFLAVDSLGKNPYQIKDFYFGDAGLIDIFRKDAKDWFWNYYHKQMKMGVEAWWGDLGEPEMHPSNMYHKLKVGNTEKLFSADAIHNIYGHTWTKMLFEKYAVHYPNKRLFSLNRSGFAGTQRYSIFPWTGDVSRSWKGFNAQLPVLLGMSMSGIPYVHSDAGGFAGGEGDNELYIRWLQMAAFTPVFRPHGTALYEIEKAAFSFPSEPALIAEPYRSIAKKIVHQRYQFLPYNYTLAYEQTVQKQPLLRPLYFENPSDTNSYKFEDEYYWGNQIIVAPILAKSAESRKVYLPKGEWYHYYTNEKIIGGKSFNQTVNLSTIPFYIKAGTLLPLGDDSIKGNTHTISNKSIAIHYYPSSEKSSYTLYNDDGTSKNAIATHSYELITFTGVTDFTKKEYAFTIHSDGGNYPQKPITKKLKFQIEGKPFAFKTISINGKKKAFAKGDSDKFLVEFVGKDLKIVLKG